MLLCCFVGCFIDGEFVDFLEFVHRNHIYGTFNLKKLLKKMNKFDLQVFYKKFYF